MIPTFQINTYRGYVFWLLAILGAVDIPLLCKDFADIRVFAWLLEALDDRIMVLVLAVLDD